MLRGGRGRPGGKPGRPLSWANCAQLTPSHPVAFVFVFCENNCRRQDVEAFRRWWTTRLTCCRLKAESQSGRGKHGQSSRRRSKHWLVAIQDGIGKTEDFAWTA